MTFKKGCTLFYLDSFGDSLEDVKLMRWLREKLGPGIRTYCEHQCDAITPFSGGYSETTLHADQTNAPPHYRLWSGVKEWEIYRWLCPGSEIATRLHDVKGQPLIAPLVRRNVREKSRLRMGRLTSGIN